MGNWTLVGPYWAPQSLISSTHFSWSLRPLAEMPISFTLRFSKSGALHRTLESSRTANAESQREAYLRATSASSVVQTGV